MSDVDLLIWIMGAALAGILALVFFFPHRFGMKTRAEAKADEGRVKQRQQEVLRVAVEAEKVKLAAMSESEAKHYLDRKFRIGALLQMAMWAGFAALAYYVLFNEPKPANLTWWKEIGIWGLMLGSGVAAVVNAYRAAVGKEFSEKTIAVVIAALVMLVFGGCVIAGLVGLLYWTSVAPLTVLVIVVAIGFYAVVKAIERNKG